MNATRSARLMAVVTLGLALAACAGDDQASLAAPRGVDAALASLHTPAPRARLALRNPNFALAHAGRAAWTLSKTGTVNAAQSTITWQITATQNGAVAKTITVTGGVTVRNIGTAGATIGNVVLRLDRKEAKWVPVAYNVANATHGDAATSALVVDPTNDDSDEDEDDNLPMKVDLISESPGSGSLAFTEGASTPLSLVPQVMIAPGATLDLRFTATFDNTVLNIPVGEKLRANIKITSGNAGLGPKTVPTLDINGSGAIDADEGRVRSKGRNLGLHTLGQPTNTQTPVVLSDALADVTTTGTVTFSNAVFNLGATSGTVSVKYAGGAAGGSITNCAHLAGMGLSLEACDTQGIAADAAHEWSNGEIVTYAQQQWGGTGSGSSGLLLSSNFLAVYPNGSVEIGGAFIAVFSTANAIIAYLPATGLPRAFATSYFDPTATSAGTFGGDVLALQLNVDFSAAGVPMGSLVVPFGKVQICNVPSLPLLHGTTVSQFLQMVNTLIGGGSSSYTIDQVADFTTDLTTSFTGGSVSQFARDHLALGSCP